MDMNPKVSVVVPTKNRINVTLKCLKSIHSQTLTPFEVIVIDDGSNDGTSLKIQKDFPEVKLLWNENSKGGAVARNQGADIATGEFIAFVDSDDEWLPDHLENKIKLINSDKSEGAFGTFFLQKGMAEKNITFHIDHKSNGNIGNSILSEKRFDVRTSTLVFRREAFLNVKFDENLKKHQDWDLAINFDRLYRLTFDKEPTARIYVEQEEERMSQKLQHESSFYFIEKNAEHLDSNSIFMFCMKQIMRSQLANDSQEVIGRYKSFAAKYSSELSLRNKILFWTLQSGLVNLGSIYRWISKMRT